MAPYLRPLEDLAARLPVSRRLRRVGGVLLLLLVGWLDYITGPEIAAAPFYIPILVVIGFTEPWWICLLYSGLATLIYLGVDLISSPGTATLIYPYWRAFARLFSFVLISTAISQLVGERRRLRLSEQGLQENTQELEEKNRALEETMRELKRLQGDLVAKERQAAIAETIYTTTYEMERPLASVSVYLEELLQLAQENEEIYPLLERIRGEVDTEEFLRLVRTSEEVHPLLEKVAERIQDMERILESIRDLRKKGGGRSMLKTPDPGHLRHHGKAGSLREKALQPASGEIH